MIISHQHQFIFIKCRKVAGSSMERSLADVCGPDDIISEDPCRPPLARNYNPRFPLLRELAGTPSPIQMARTLRDWRIKDTFYTHIDAYSARQRLGKKTWDRYFKFAFERNPWDKCVSFYYWFYRRQKDNPPVSFEDHYMRRWALADRHIPIDWRRYTIGGSIAADFIGDFDRKAEDFARVMDQLGLECGIGHKEKTSTRNEATRDVASVYNDRTRDRVASLFRREIEHFGYEFPG